MKRFFLLRAAVVGVSAVLLIVMQVSAQKSLDELDRICFKAGFSPLEKKADVMDEAGVGTSGEFTGEHTLSLSGEWILAEDSECGRPAWEVAVPATVPGSVHSALFKAGRIPNPMIGRNDSVAEKCSYRRWWLKKTFVYDKNWQNPKLRFKGVANRCQIWLNGHYLGMHEGMFGGPDYRVGKLLKKGGNELLVLLDSIPQVYRGGWPSTANEAWKQTVVANCVYGWHYAKIPSLGIWQNVFLEECPSQRIENSFLITKSLLGDMRLNVKLVAEDTEGSIWLHVEPYNFIGNSQKYCWEFKRKSGEVNLDFRIDSPKLWYPNGMGKQPLYLATVDLVSGNRVLDREKVIFGVRTVDMKPLPGGPLSLIHI